MVMAHGHIDALQIGLRSAMEEVSEWCKRKGWEPDPDRTFGDECALIHSEVSEALEAYRDDKFVETLVYEFPHSGGTTIIHWKMDQPEPSLVSPVEIGDSKDPNVVVPVSQLANMLGVVPKPCGVASEFADIFIRLLHYCFTHDINLSYEFLKKMKYNETRSYRHGGRAL